MVEYNPRKLINELQAAGLAVDGADSTGKISWTQPATKEDLFKADKVKNEHNPVDMDQLKKMLYPKITEEGILKTLKHLQSSGISLGEDAEDWISQVERVKENYPEE